MILHCYYCALGGDRRSHSSEVAIVDEDKLQLPLTADMFLPLDPAHDQTVPFITNEWRYMLHRACGKYPWPFNVNPIHGPSRILTDQGIIDIPDSPPIPGEIVTMVKSYVCDCGAIYQHASSLSRHKKDCKAVNSQIGI